MTQDDKNTITAARELLVAPFEHDQMSLAERAGALEWHLIEVLHLAERLGAADKSQS